MASDLEKGEANRTRPSRSASVRHFLPSLLKDSRRLPETALPWGQRQHDLYRPGYPLYTSLLGSSPEFQIFRRFRHVRMRLLLLKQDKVVQLKERLNQIDTTEEKELFLGNSRRDRNVSRRKVLDDLDEALLDYDALLQRTQWSLNQHNHSHKRLQMIQEWLESNGSIARDETSYLEPEDYWDLMNIGPRLEENLPTFYPAVEKLIYLLESGLNKIFSQPKDKVGTISISRSKIRVFTRTLTASFTIILLLVPIIALNAVPRTLYRFIIIFIAAALFVSLLTLASSAGLPEVLTAGAAYAAVLVVFVSGNGVAG